MGRHPGFPANPRCAALSRSVPAGCDKAGKGCALLGPGDVPIQDAEVRQAFFKEVGQQSDFQAVLEHDFTGANARARRIDERRVMPLNDKIKGLEAQITETQQQRRAMEADVPPTADDIERFANKARQKLHDLNFEQKRAIVVNTVEKVVRTQQQLQVFGYISIPDHVEFNTINRHGSCATPHFLPRRIPFDLTIPMPPPLRRGEKGGEWITASCPGRMLPVLRAPIGTSYSVRPVRRRSTNDESYGEIEYIYGGRSDKSRSTSHREVLPLLYGLADIPAPQPIAGDDYPGYPLVGNARATLLWFFSALPILIIFAWWLDDPFPRTPYRGQAHPAPDCEMAEGRHHGRWARNGGVAAPPQSG